MKRWFFDLIGWRMDERGLWLALLIVGTPRWLGGVLAVSSRAEDWGFAVCSGARRNPRSGRHNDWSLLCIGAYGLCICGWWIVDNRPENQ